MMAGDTAGLGLSISSDAFRQLKDRRKHRTSRAEKNPGILRFGSLSVKVMLIYFKGKLRRRTLETGLFGHNRPVAGNSLWLLHYF